MLVELPLILLLHKHFCQLLLLPVLLDLVQGPPAGQVAHTGHLVVLAASPRGELVLFIVYGVQHIVEDHRRLLHTLPVRVHQVLC